MKFSKIAFILSAISIGILLYFIVKNERLEIGRGIMMDTGEIVTYHPTVKINSFLWHMSEPQFQKWKRNETLNIISNGWWAPAGFILLGISLVIIENKNNPIKRLEELRKNSIIDDDEFNKKILRNEVLINSQVKDKQFKKLKKELEPLKEKGLLTEKEYQEKIILIQKKLGIPDRKT